MKSILVVDDDPESLEQIKSQLADKYEVFLAKSGELTLEICREKKPDLILLDVGMPKMNGFLTISQLKNDPVLKNIPVIFLTNNHDEATEVKCLKSGAMDFITKPANTEIFHHRINLQIEFSDYQQNLENMIKELQDNIVISFAELVECKDPNIIDHVIHSGMMAQYLTKELVDEGAFSDELSHSDIDLMMRAVPLHDIGKIGISDLLLLKRGPLTESEYEEVKKHTTIGGRMLEQIYNSTPNEHYLLLASVIAEGHHERYDGLGYPRGLKGDKIPLCCRIMAVVNVYCGCVTDKIYRKKLSHEESCQIILDGSGTIFDPRVVDVFSRIQGKLINLYKDPLNYPKYFEWSSYNE